MIGKQKFLNRLKDDYHLRQVYWRNPSKIILLNMIFSTIKESRERNGYHEDWMSEYKICINKTDKKINNYLQKY
jgi:hypothetical protein